MNAIDERAIRDQLRRAVSALDPPAPPLDALRAQAQRRRRLRYAVGAGMAAAAAAIVVAVLVVVPGSGHKSAVIAAAPSRDSLTAYAAAHHGSHVAGPVESASGYYGAFAVTRGIQVARYVGDGWQMDGAAVTTYGPGRFVAALSDGGGLIPGRPSFAMRYVGGDVSYFGGVLYLANEGLATRSWQAARFNRCDNRELSCWHRSTDQPYGHIVRGAFVSLHNDCTPYCAAGHSYRVTWRWSSAAQQFEAVAAHPAGRWADRP